MLETSLQLELVPEEFSVVQLSTDLSIPRWVDGAHFFSLTRTADEVSIVVPETLVPSGTKADHGWRCIKVKGILDFELVGVLASLLVPLARARIPVFVLSTYNTDYLLVKTKLLEKSIQVLSSAGHHIVLHNQCSS